MCLILLKSTISEKNEDVECIVMRNFFSYNVTPALLWLFLCEQKKKFGFDIYCNKMHMHCLKIAEKILCIANAQKNLIPGFGFLPKCPTSEKIALCNTI